MNTSNRETALAQLLQHQLDMRDFKLVQAFDLQPERATNMSVTAAGLYFDYSKNLVNDQSIELLGVFARACQLEKHRDAMFDGAIVNSTEARAALHSLIRTPIQDTSKKLLTQRRNIEDTFEKMAKFVADVHSEKWTGFSGKPIQAIVNIGIGGSDLGPAMVSYALQPYQQAGITSYFVSNVDATDIQQVLAQLNPETTLFIISSKTFTTLETLSNAQLARDWLSNAAIGKTDSAIAKHFVAVSAAPEKAVAFGIAENNVFTSWDWIGGRYSLWSATGLPIALAVGMDNFYALLAGANAMDNHFRQAPITENIPMLQALLSFWYVNCWGCRSFAILPYDQLLLHFPDYLQQLEMESNGKSVTIDGQPLKTASCPVVFGSVGTNGQHSFHQLLHQGTQLIPTDFIASKQGHYDQGHNNEGSKHSLLFANCLAQSQALMLGKDHKQALTELLAMGHTADQASHLAAHKIMPGNRPSTTLIVDKLTPKTLGALIALYEHKVFSLSVLWQINCFDQWGVEYGKQLSNLIHNSISTGEPNNANFDTSTQQLIKQFLKPPEE